MTQMLRSLDVLILDPFFDQESFCHSQLIRFNGKTRLRNDVVGNNVNGTQLREAAKKNKSKCRKDKG